MRATLDEVDEGTTTSTVVDGRYVLEDVIATGGMGIVYRAHHATIGTRLAVKVLKPSSAHDPDASARFRREARTASALAHPNIVGVHDFGVLPDGRSYFVMELLDGPDLGTEIAERGPMGSVRTTKIALQILDALAAAHACEIVHRDLKPENVVLIRDSIGEERVKVLDFGIAKIVGDKLALSDVKPALASGATFLPNHSLPGLTLGTPAYMSPEHCRGNPLDARSDLYALGVMLYEMVTGEVPFDHESLWELMRLHMDAEPRPPSEIAPDVAPALEAVILKCLKKDPAERFADALEVSRALRAVIEPAVASIAPVAPVPTPRPSIAPPPPRRGYWIVGLAGGLAAALAGAALAVALYAEEPGTIGRSAAPVSPAPIVEEPAREPDMPLSDRYEAQRSEAPSTAAPVEPALPSASTVVRSATHSPAAGRAAVTIEHPRASQSHDLDESAAEAGGSSEPAAVEEPAALESTSATVESEPLPIERAHPLLDPWEQ